MLLSAKEEKEWAELNIIGQLQDEQSSETSAFYFLMRQYRILERHYPEFIDTFVEELNAFIEDYEYPGACNVAWLFLRLREKRQEKPFS